MIFKYNFRYLLLNLIFGVLYVKKMSAINIKEFLIYRILFKKLGSFDAYQGT